MPCASHAVAVGDRLDDLGERTETVLVTFTGADNLERYCAANPLPYPILRDPDRSAYRAFGLGRGATRRVWGLRAGRRYAELLRGAGLGGLRRLGRPVEDTLQLGGDFVVAPDGTLAYGHWSEGPDDRPPIEDLVAAANG